MKYFHGTMQFGFDRPSAVTLGKFDGLHLGHQKLIERIQAQKAAGLSSVVFMIAPPDIPRLLTGQEMYQMLAARGVDCLVACPFVPEILHMSPEQFVTEILTDRLNARYLAVGTDFRFGYRRSGDAAFLQEAGKRYGIQVEVIEKECLDGREISSTLVREALERADLERVSALLGYPFCVSGTVLHGRQLGRKLGMPTLNLIPEAGKLLPPYGVYYSRTRCGTETYQSITNIGKKPTVDGSFVGVETYLYEFEGDFYQREITVELLSFRRPEQKFDSVEALKAQMQRDIHSGKEYFREH